MKWGMFKRWQISLKDRFWLNESSYEMSGPRRKGARTFGALHIGTYRQWNPHTHWVAVYGPLCEIALMYYTSYCINWTCSHSMFGNNRVILITFDFAQLLTDTRSHSHSRPDLNYNACILLILLNCAQRNQIRLKVELLYSWNECARFNLSRSDPHNICLCPSLLICYKWMQGWVEFCDFYPEISYNFPIHNLHWSFRWECGCQVSVFVCRRLTFCWCVETTMADDRVLISDISDEQQLRQMVRSIRAYSLSPDLHGFYWLHMTA